MRVVTRILLPQLTPSLIAAALLTFMTSMASFSAPLLFGGGVRVLTLEIYTARQARRCKSGDNRNGNPCRDFAQRALLLSAL